MALPLPSVVSNVGPGGRVLDSMQAGNAFANGLLKNQNLAITNQYSPYTNYANALSKIAYANYLPFQLQAQALSNPMLWGMMKDNPGAAQSMLSNFSSSVPQLNNIPGMGAIPLPHSGNGLLSTLMSKIGGGQSNNAVQQMTQGQPTNPSQLPVLPGGNGVGNFTPPSVQNALATGPTDVPGQSQNSTLLPSAQGMVPGIIGAKTASFVQSPFEKGLIPDQNNPGKAISAPDKSNVSTNQAALGAIERVAPILNRVASLGEPFFTIEGRSALTLGRLQNISQTVKDQFGGASKLPDLYDEWQSTLEAAPEALVKAYGLKTTKSALSRLSRTIQPHIGDDQDLYKQRILRQLKEIQDEQGGSYQRQIAQGYNVGSATPGQQNTKNNNQGSSNKHWVFNASTGNLEPQ